MSTTYRQITRRLRNIVAVALLAMVAGQCLALEHVHAELDELSTCHLCGAYDNVVVATPEAVSGPRISSAAGPVTATTTSPLAAPAIAYQGRAPPLS